MPDEAPVDQRLERQARRLGRPGGRFALVAAVMLALGILLWVLGDGVLRIVGIVVVALSAAPAVVGGALVLAAGVAHWAAHRRPFA